MKNLIKRLLAKIGYTIVRLTPTVDHAFIDQHKLVGDNPVIIFDIGACNGGIALLYNELFKKSNIYCFEPFIPSFEELKKNTARFNNISIFNMAFSNVSGQIDFHVNNFPPTNSILATHPDSNKNWGEGLLDTKEKIKVKSITLDEFIDEYGIEKIDILKLDTQGSEYQILEGASKSIEQNKISLIYLEIIIMSTYQQQKSFDEILLLLRNKGFTLYNLYNYSYTNLGELRQVDAIFIRK